MQAKKEEKNHVVAREEKDHADEEGEENHVDEERGRGGSCGCQTDDCDADLTANQ